MYAGGGKKTGPEARVAAIKAQMGAVEWLLLGGLSIVWGGAFFFGKLAVGELAPFSIVLGRVAIAALVLNVVLIAAGHRLPTTIGGWAPFLAMGLLNNVVPFSLIFWGQTRIPSGLAAILNATTPLFTVLVAHWLTRDERLSANRIVGLGCGVFGVAVMVGPAALAGFDQDVLARVAILGAALSYGFAAVFGRRFRGQPPLVTAAGQVSASTVVMLPIALAVDRPWQALPLDAGTIGAVLGLGLLSTALGYVVYFRVLAAAGATNVALVTLMVPASALLLGAVLLGERLESREFAGMGLIAAGLIANDGRLPAALGRLVRGGLSPGQPRDAVP